MRFRWAVAIVCAIATVLVSAGSASSIVGSRSPAASFTFSSPDPQDHSRIQVKVCVARAVAGWLVRLQQAEGTGHVWRTIEQYRLPLATDCGSIPMSTGNFGLKPFRVQLFDGTTLKLQTHVKNLYVYGVVQGDVFFGQKSSPYLNDYWKTVVANGHVYPTLGRMDSGTNEQSLKKNTCKWVVFELLSTDNHTGDPKSDGVSTFQIDQYSIDPHSLTFDDNVVTKWGSTLDGSIFSFNYSNTNARSSMYILTNGTEADCYSATGF
jgi:hypothetical protein